MSTTSVDDIRSRNRKRVLEVVRQGGVSSRTEIGHQTGLSAATVSAITSDLLDEGILKPPLVEATGKPGRGRPKVALTINPDAAIVCAAYFQLNRVTANIVDYSGATINEVSLDIKSEEITEEQIKQALLDCIEQALVDSNQSRSQLRRIALGFQGVTDVAGSCVLWSPICKQRNMPVQKWLEDYFEVPARVANDCDMIAQALNWREPEKYGKNFAAVLLARGVGMGLFLRNAIINGISSSGVEFGHMNYIPDGALCRCGKKGCIEAYAGDYAISRKAKGEEEFTAPSSFFDPPDLEKIADVARKGDKHALSAIEDAGKAIGKGLASLFSLVDRIPVVLVGSGAGLFNLMEKALRDGLDDTPGSNGFQDVEIDVYTDEHSLVREGCAISALLVQDDELASRRPQRF